MKDFFEEKIDVRSYQMGIFALMKRRSRFTNDEYRIIQVAYGDADDFDPIVRLEYTILEPELRRRVANSIEELAALGFDGIQVDIEAGRS